MVVSRGIFAVALVWTALGASAAQAATHTGATTQGRSATLITRADGHVTRLAVSFAMRCRRTGVRVSERVVFVPPLRTSTPTSFSDGGTQTGRVDRRARVRVTVAVRGRRTDDHTWRGTLRIASVVTERGRVLDRCDTGTVGWRAAIPRATLDMASERGDFIGKGATYAYRTPATPVVATGNRRVVKISMGGWDVELAAPRGRTLTPGHFPGASRYPFHGAGAGLSVTGHGRGCNRVAGEFTVHASSFDRRGRLRAIDASFVHRCEEVGPPLRGRVTFRR